MHNLSTPSPAAGSGSNRVRALAWAFLVLLLALVPVPASAQQEVLRSAMAGVTFPVPAQMWFPDPRRTQATTINDAAADAGKSCTTYEFSIWYVTNAAESEDIRTRTEAAFTQAGWALELAAVPTAEQIGYLARRVTDELIMAWVIRPEELGLLLCVAGPPAAPLDEGAAGAIQVDDGTRAADGTPLPRGNPARPGVDLPADPVIGLAPPPAAPPDGITPAPGPDGIAGVIDAAPLAPLAGTTEAAPAETAATPAPEPAATAPAAAASQGGSGFSLGLFLLAAVLGGAAFLLIRLGMGAMAARTGGRWPNAIATVVYSQVASEERKTRTGKPGTRYVPVVAYEYEVEGTLYRAARLKFGDTSSPELNQARHTTERYPVGAGIEIHYNPTRPAEAVVETGHDTVNAALIAGVALAVLAIASLLSAIA